MIPCKSCPWRVDQDVSAIPGYCQEKAERLLDTVGKEDGFRKMMACHQSTEEEPTICKGYLAQAGWSNLNVRLRVMKGQLTHPDQVQEACKAADVELEPNYESVLAKLSET